MRILEVDGVRTFRRELRAVQLAQAIGKALGGRPEAYLSDIVKAMDWPYTIDPLTTAAYQATARALPFEIAGVVYTLESGEAPRAWRKSKTIVARPGRLEDYTPPSTGSGREKARAPIDARIDARVGELAQWTNVFALREEARKYMDARLGAIEERLSIVEKAIDNSAKV